MRCDDVRYRCLRCEMRYEMFSILIITLSNFFPENKFRKLCSNVGLEEHFIIQYLALYLQILIIY